MLAIVLLILSAFTLAGVDRRQTICCETTLQRPNGKDRKKILILIAHKKLSSGNNSMLLTTTTWMQPLPQLSLEMFITVSYILVTNLSEIFVLDD
jgi:hypothetical protein